jgi:hypothetical protein
MIDRFDPAWQRTRKSDLFLEILEFFVPAIQREKWACDRRIANKGEMGRCGFSGSPMP